TPAAPPPLPLPPPPAPPPPAPPSHTAQPNDTKNPAPDSKSLENTLEKLRAMQAQNSPPTRRANPDSSRAPVAGGRRTGDLTGRLTAAQRGAIGDKVRECWTKDAGALDLDKMSVQLIVTVDASGTARDAEVGPEDAGRLGDPRFRAFAERARRAVLSPRCSNLPIPPGDLGGQQKLYFRFKP
ncbi:MAG TPA: hypothetical protein VL154_00615, partial [Acetobacteraceae bacterium]|nr:hypothetical protein [Acetobacteraceae bacterium]